MKKSELKALIREAINEVKNDEINEMIQILENNPQFVESVMKKYGNILIESDMGRRAFLGKLAKGIVGGIGAASALRGSDNSTNRNDWSNYNQRFTIMDEIPDDVVKSIFNESQFEKEIMKVLKDNGVLDKLGEYKEMSNERILRMILSMLENENNGSLVDAGKRFDAMSKNTNREFYSVAYRELVSVWSQIRATILDYARQNVLGKGRSSGVPKRQD